MRDDGPRHFHSSERRPSAWDPPSGAPGPRARARRAARASTGLVRFGRFEIDLHARQLRADGKRVGLQHQVFELLVCLLERPGELIGRRALCARLWPRGTFVDFEHGLNTAVRKLRLALEDSAEAPRYVQTVIGRGYRFLGQLEAGAGEPHRMRVPDPPCSLPARPPFVGRTRELATLEARLAEARAGQGGFVLLAGEAGIGKTRLLDEFGDRARRKGALVLAGRCTRIDGPSPCGPLGEAIAAWVRGTAQKALRAVADPSWSSVVARLAPPLRERLADLFEPAGLRPDEERAHLFDALPQFFAALAKRAPSVLLLDDLHWAEPETIAVLLRLAGTAQRTRLLIVGSHRDDEVNRAHALCHLIDALGHGGGFEQLPLRGLGPAPVGAWIEAVAPGASGPALRDGVQRATGGNPFFVRELLLAWRDRDEDDGETIEGLAIPRSIRAMVAQRLAKLGEDTRRLLGAASAFHGVFRFEVARRAARLDEEAALDALDEARAAHLVRSEGGADDYDFVHALIRQVLYDGLTPARRLRILRRIADDRQRGASAGGAHAAGRGVAQLASEFSSNREDHVHAGRLEA